jgi:thiol-disulfide isomerase/thioredoxin
MNKLTDALKLFTFLLLLVVVESATAENKASDIEVPFGIRSHDIGAAKNFTLTDIDGEKLELARARGSWIFLHFWASWCGPCKEEMPEIQQLSNALKDEAFKIVMVNTAEDEDTVFEFLATINVDLNSLMDIDGLVTEDWKPRGLPTTFLINPKGEIKYQAIGGREWGKPEYIDFIKRLITASK